MNIKYYAKAGVFAATNLTPTERSQREAQGWRWSDRFQACLSSSPHQVEQVKGQLSEAQLKIIKRMKKGYTIHGLFDERHGR